MKALLTISPSSYARLRELSQAGILPRIDAEPICGDGHVRVTMPMELYDDIRACADPTDWTDDAVKKYLAALDVDARDEAESAMERARWLALRELWVPAVAALSALTIAAAYLVTHS